MVLVMELPGGAQVFGTYSRYLPGSFWELIFFLGFGSDVLCYSHSLSFPDVKLWFELGGHSKPRGLPCSVSF